MKIYELIEQHFSKGNIEQNFVITSHYDNEEDAVQEFFDACNFELQDIADIEEDIADELNAKIEQYRYYAEDKHYMNSANYVCDALQEDNIIAYFACYKNEYRKESENVRLILKEIEL